MISMIHKVANTIPIISSSSDGALGPRINKLVAAARPMIGDRMGGSTARW